MTEQVVIQERIDEVMNEEFTKLLRENSDDKLLKLLIDEKLDDYSVEKLVKYLEED
jgi:hypothetical protein